jgi:hypothetical protein
MRTSLALILASTALLLTSGCSEQQQKKWTWNPPPDPRLQGYKPWEAPATDTLVDIWYLSATPEEFDRYWLEPKPHADR